MTLSSMYSIIDYCSFFTRLKKSSNVIYVFISKINNIFNSWNLSVYFFQNIDTMCMLQDYGRTYHVATGICTQSIWEHDRSARSRT